LKSEQQKAAMTLSYLLLTRPVRMRTQRSGGGFDFELIDERPGFIALTVKGRDAFKYFCNERGGHRYQRIPPTEKRGRVQTSTITVAVFDISAETPVGLNMSDVEIRTTRGTGPGGQHRNTTESCVIATHRPTGLQARADMRSQHQSKATALRVLAAKVTDSAKAKAQQAQATDRRLQIGSGQRGDKVRTYRERDNQVVDHASGKRWRFTDWARGIW
jgi:peptide chain release factor 1